MMHLLVKRRRPQPGFPMGQSSGKCGATAGNFTTRKSRVSCPDCLAALYGPK